MNLLAMVSKYATSKTVIVHSTEIFGASILKVKVKIGFDTDGDKLPDVWADVDAGGVDVFEETLKLPEMDILDPEAVFEYVVKEIEDRGIDIPGIGSGS